MPAPSMTAHYTKVCMEGLLETPGAEGTFAPDKDVTLHGWGVFV
jgi:hypothetical protein